MILFITPQNWLETLVLPFSSKKVYPKPIVTRSQAFSRAYVGFPHLRRLHVISSFTGGPNSRCEELLLEMVSLRLIYPLKGTFYGRYNLDGFVWEVTLLCCLPYKYSLILQLFFQAAKNSLPKNLIFCQSLNL